MSRTPTLLFVHGAWHSSDCWSNVILALQTRGFHCLAPQLQFCGTSKPVESLASSINQIRRLIFRETKKGSNIVLINHSFGGSVGCSAVKGFTPKDPSELEHNAGRVIGIIQLCAFMPPSNVSLYDMIDPRKAFHHPDPDGWEVVYSADPSDIFYNDLPKEMADHWKSRLLKQSAASFIDHVNVYAGWMDVPISYIFTTQDRAIPIENQKAMVDAAKKAGALITSESLEAGHSPFLSRVEETVDLIVDAVTEF
ncbi:alpha/beta hydrolase [Aspergillus neoniger CBS 115656]|uniref:Alpha/beta-hydrolase n=1 Tax=Aspergillus neoniger (strain CBS 115656) TaxID=1448310 RepID=A0A318Y450_ASPNB|nr:alpha/beta-hydrolase [Aspergillus neoniger CBS 115656]PYH28217.1 alpha/beta-hydrolase [Aspergillus neoniger CBS 115656]